MADITIGIVLFVLFAGLIAAIVRNRDIPVSVVSIKLFIMTFVGCLIAAVLVTWMLVDANGSGYTDSFDSFMTFANFTVVAGSAVGGLALVQSILSFIPGTEAYKSKKAKQ